MKKDKLHSMESGYIGTEFFSSTSTRKRTWRTIPRVASLSGTSTVSPMRFSPSARIVPRLRAMWLMVLFVWVTRSLPAIANLHGGLTGHEGSDPDAPARAQLFGRMQAPEGLQGGPSHVDRVAGAEDLGQDVANARCLDDGADCAAGDDAGTLRCRLENYFAKRRSPCGPRAGSSSRPWGFG